MLKKKFYICYSGNKCSEKYSWGKKKNIWGKKIVLSLKTSLRYRFSEFYCMSSQAKNCQIWNELPP